MEILLLLTKFVPVVNVVMDVWNSIGGEEPTWWEWPVKIFYSLIVVQFIILPPLKRVSENTDWQWDDRAVTKVKFYTTEAIRLALDISSVSPDLHERLRKIRDRFKKR